MRALQSAVLDLHLDRYHLCHAGSRTIQAQRLWDHTHPEDSTGSDTSTPQESGEDGGSTTSHSPVTSAADSSGTEDNSIPYTSDSNMRFTVASRHPSRRHHRPRHSPRSHRRSPSLSSSLSDESRSRSRHALGPHVPASDPPQNKHRHHHHKRSHIPSLHCTHYIVRGEFIEFTDLLGELMMAMRSIAYLAS